MSNIENTGLIEGWYLGEARWGEHNRIFGIIRNHMQNGRPGRWDNTGRDMIFGIRKDLYRQNPDRYQKGDIVMTSSSILVLGNPRD